VSSEDLEPTLLEYAGAEPVAELRGRSLVPAIQTGAPFGRDKMVTTMGLVVGGGVGHVVRTAAWRYISFPDGHEELYDIVADPYETTDVVAAHPDLLPGFRADVQAWDVAIVTPPPSLEVTGRLTDATTGQPIAGAQLDLELGGHAVRSITGDDGWFAFRALPQGSGLLARGPGTINVQRLGSTLIQVDLPVGALGAYLPVTGTAARTLSGPLDGEIRGRLRDLGGQPLSRQRIRVRGRAGSGAGFRLAVLTDLDGSYRVEQLPAGAYRLKARAVGYRRVVVETSLATSEVVVVDLSATPRLRE
jgi:hypothetical protein